MVKRKREECHLSTEGDPEDHFWVYVRLGQLVIIRRTESLIAWMIAMVVFGRLASNGGVQG
jgi:hypothetical protein